MSYSLSDVFQEAITDKLSAKVDTDAVPTTNYLNKVVGDMRYASYAYLTVTQN